MFVATIFIPSPAEVAHTDDRISTGYAVLPLPMQRDGRDSSAPCARRSTRIPSAAGAAPCPKEKHARHEAQQDGARSER
jgi:hypothetical protein